MSSAPEKKLSAPTVEKQIHNVLLNPDDAFVQAIYDQLTHTAKLEAGKQETLRRWVPSLIKEQISTLIETAFWASLGTDEGRTTHVCIAVARPDVIQDVFQFQKEIPYKTSEIIRLAAAVPRGGCLLISEGDQLNIWGIGRSRPRNETLTIEICKPGTVRIGLGIFRTFALLNGQSKSILGSTGIDLASDLQRVLQKDFREDDFIETQVIWQECNALVELVSLIVEVGHGGIILIVPSDSGEWRKALSPFEYQFRPSETTVRGLIRESFKGIELQPKLAEQLTNPEISDDFKKMIFDTFAAMESIGREKTRNFVRAISSLAGTDGAIVMTRDLKLLGFGAKIAVQSEEAKAVYIVDLPYNGVPIRKSLEEVGGTRHQSSVKFTAETKNSVALVISQDRHVSLMSWDDQAKSVVVRRNIEWRM